MKTGNDKNNLFNYNLSNKKILFKKERKKFLKAMGFLIIPLIFFTFFVVVPVFQAAYFSLFKWNGLGPMTNYVGLKNFITIIKNEIFHRALINNSLIVFLSLSTQLPIALILALVIGRRFKGNVVFRTVFFLPFILSEIIAGTVWSFIYNPQFGLQNSPLSNIFPWFNSFSFLGDTNLVFGSIFVVIFWKYFGLHMVIYIAGIQGIPYEIEEAALIDGVNEWQLNWNIIIPLLKPAILISVFFSIIGSFQTFDIIWAMSKGGPVNASETMVTYLYKFGFQRFQLGYGSAVAIVIFLVCVFFNIFYQKFILGEEN